MFRILTEDKNVECVRDFLDRYCVDYTMYRCEGSWQGSRERSMLIELDGVSLEIAEALAQYIKRANVQEAVLVQEIPAKSRLI